MFHKEHYTLEKFEEAIKHRNIWLNNFKMENMRIKAILLDAFYPYQILIQQNLKNMNIDSDYEIDTYLCIKDETRLQTEINDWFGSKTNSYIEISLYFLPKSFEEEDDNINLPEVNLTEKEKNSIEKIIQKFSDEIRMQVKIIYE